MCFCLCVPVYIFSVFACVCVLDVRSVGQRWEGGRLPGSCTSPTSLHADHYVAETQSQSNTSKQSMALVLKFRFSGDLHICAILGFCQSCQYGSVCVYIQTCMCHNQYNMLCVFIIIMLQCCYNVRKNLSFNHPM